VSSGATGQAAGSESKLALATLIVTAAAGTVLSWLVAQHSLVGARWKFLLLVALWVPVWVAGALAAGRVGPRRLALALLVLFSLLIRLAAATGTTPSISNDAYRYGWDARVQLHGIDPYTYPPDAPQLRALRTAVYWPSPAACGHLRMGTGCSTLNRPEVRTIYPPVAEAWFVVVTVAYPGHDGSRPWQLAGALVDTAVVVALMVCLGRYGRDPRQVAWYALCPIPVIEFAGNGHVDGLALLLLVAALLALERGRRGLAGFLIGLATMVKLYPALALVACWRKGGIRMLVFAVATVAAVELPHLLAVGSHLLGYLPGYLKEEHYASGGRYLLLGILALSGPATSALAVVCVSLAAVWVLRAGPEPATGLVVLLTVVILVATPVQPWYAVGLGGLGLLVGAPWLVLPAAAGEIYYAAVILDSPHQIGIGRLCYGTALVAIVTVIWVGRRRRGKARAGQDPPPTGISSTRSSAVAVTARKPPPVSSATEFG